MGTSPNSDTSGLGERRSHGYLTSSRGPPNFTTSVYTLQLCFRNWIARNLNPVSSQFPAMQSSFTKLKSPLIPDSSWAEVKCLTPSSCRVRAAVRAMMLYCYLRFCGGQEDEGQNNVGTMFTPLSYGACTSWKTLKPWNFHWIVFVKFSLCSKMYRVFQF